MAIVTAHVAAVQQLYVAYFNRPADYAGLDYWTNVVAAQNGSTAAVSAAFAAEAEYKTAYANLTNAQIVDKVYQNLFGRAAEDAGKKYWADLLDSKQITIDKVVAEVAKGAQTTDAEAYENKVAGATAFTAALDTKAEQDGYRGDAANVLAKAFITSITTDASLATATAPAALNASVAGVVAAGTPFTLEGAMANLLAAQKAKSDVLADLAEEEAVADALEAANVTGTPTDAQIEAAIKSVQSAAATGANGILGSSFSTDTAAVQSAKIALEEANLAKTLADAKKALTTANTEAAKVANLPAAIADYTEAAAASEEASIAAGLAQTAANTALDNLEILNGGASIDTSTANTIKLGTTTILTQDATTKVWKLAPTVTETTTKGVTAALTALNASEKANAAATKASDAAAEAFLAADILDTADNGTLLATLKSKFVFTTLPTTAVPTYAEIQVESQQFVDRIAALDATAGAGGYTGALAALNTAVGTSTEATLPGLLTTAVNNGYITAADRTAIITAAGTGAGFSASAGATAVSANNWAARKSAFDTAWSNVVDAEKESAEAGIGNLAKDVVDAQEDIDNTEAAIDALADAVAVYKEAMALSTGVTAADSAISAASKVITDKGYAAPATLKTTGINLSTAKDDIFLVASGNADAELRGFGVQGKDTLYVGTSLKYNNKVIGDGTEGTVQLNKAGDNSVLEFFLEQSGNNVIVHIENKVFGSESGANADMTTITLVGVDLDEVTVSNGFITV